MNFRDLYNTRSAVENDTLTLEPGVAESRSWLTYLAVKPWQLVLRTQLAPELVSSFSVTGQA